MIFENTLSLEQLLTCGIAYDLMLLTPSHLIFSRLTLINSGVVKMSITTINVILLEPKTKVLVTNSFLSIRIEE